MAVTERPIATKYHVAGPPEKEAGDTPAGWRWTQRCLRCDRPVFVGDTWWPMGADVYELTDGRMTTEPPPGCGHEGAARCAPED